MVAPHAKVAHRNWPMRLLVPSNARTTVLAWGKKQHVGRLPTNNSLALVNVRELPYVRTVFWISKPLPFQTAPTNPLPSARSSTVQLQQQARLKQVLQLGCPGTSDLFFKKKDHQVSHAAKNLSSTHQEKFKQLKSPFQSNHVHSCILWDSAFFSTDAYFISRNNLFSLLALWNCLVQ